jgi:uridine kinase
MTNTFKIIGISGGSGARKTTLANALLKRFGAKAIVISCDRYYKTIHCGNYNIPKSLDCEFQKRWTLANFLEIIYLKDSLQQTFHAEISNQCRL